jgi:hypothetical protein
MKDRQIEAGEVIYREGDLGDAVFVVKAGEVEVSRTVSGQMVRLAVLRHGAIFGEMGVLRDRPRSTTVRAIGPVTLLAILKQDFLDTFQSDNPLALTLLQMLCERLLLADSQLLEQQIYSDGAMIGEIKQIRILAAAPEVETQIGTDGVIVKKLPFLVGRRKDPGDTGGPAQANLVLHASSSSQLARQHFALEDRDGRLVVHDLESDLGTLVNGRRIASFERSDVADLQFGDNKIQAGGSESPYRFHVIVEREVVPPKT